MPGDGAPEQREVDGEEDQVHGAEADDIHLVPVAGLAAGESHHVTEVPLEQTQFAQLGDEGLHHLDLANDLGEAALSKVDVLVFLLLPHCPLLRGQSGEIEVHREDDGQEQGQWPVVERGDAEDHDDGQQHREEVIRKGINEVRQPQNRAIQAGNDSARDLVIVITLRQGQELGVIAVGEDLAHPGGEYVSEPAAHVADNSAGQFRCQQSQGHPGDGFDGHLGRGIILQGFHDDVRGVSHQERRGQSQQCSDYRGNNDGHIQWP